MAIDRNRELAKSELGELPEARLWPRGARVVRSDASGTWEGHGYDDILPGCAPAVSLVGHWSALTL